MFVSHTHTHPAMLALDFILECGVSKKQKIISISSLFKCLKQHTCILGKHLHDHHLERHIGFKRYEFAWMTLALSKTLFFNLNYCTLDELPSNFRPTCCPFSNPFHPCAKQKKTKNGGPIWENPVGDVVEEVEKMKAHTP